MVSAAEAGAGTDERFCRFGIVELANKRRRKAGSYEGARRWPLETREAARYIRFELGSFWRNARAWMQVPDLDAVRNSMTGIKATSPCVTVGVTLACPIATCWRKAIF